MRYYIYKNTNGERIEHPCESGERPPRSICITGKGVFVRDVASEIRSQTGRVKGRDGSSYKAMKGS